MAVALAEILSALLLEEPLRICRELLRKNVQDSCSEAGDDSCKAGTSFQAPVNSGAESALFWQLDASVQLKSYDQLEPGDALIVWDGTVYPLPFCEPFGQPGLPPCQPFS